MQHATIVALSRLRPQAEAAWGAIQQSLDPLIRLFSPHIETGTTWIDAHLGGLLPWQIAAVTTITVLLLAWLSQLVLAAIAELKEAGKKCASECNMGLVPALPIYNCASGQNLPLRCLNIS